LSVSPRRLPNIRDESLSIRYGSPGETFSQF
jgi:hypothetical protein